MLMMVLWLVATASTFGQRGTSVSGVVIDQKTDEPIPFVNVYFKGTTQGTITDEDGYFSIQSDANYKTVVFSFVGYDTKAVNIKKGQKQTLTVRLKSQLVNLNEVVVMSGENPAWSIIRQAVANKKQNDKRSLQAYDCNSYNRIEFDVDNISTKMSKRKLVRDIWDGIDSTALEKGKNGNAILPIFLSESVSKYYVKNNPFARREEIKKTKISGLAVEDGSMISQLIGSAYQEYNFYRNWLRILEKEFVSPIADSWKTFYDYDIEDTVMVGTNECYQLALYPNRKEDPAFNGTIWITTDSYALKKLDVYIDKATNLNFIEGISLKQELAETTAGPWLPVKTEVVVDVSNFGKNMASMLMRIYNSTSQWNLNDLKDNKFYTNEVDVAEDYSTYEPKFWDAARPTDLTPRQIAAYQTIDTLVEIPRIKSFVEFIKLATTGYWRRGKLDIGPYLYAYAHNNFEGHAFRLGVKTNEYFNRKVTLKGYAGYGTLDNRWKYGFTGNYIVSRKPWTEFQVHTSYDLEQVGIRPEDLVDNNYIFYAATRWQTFRRPYYIYKNRFSFQSEVAKGLTHKLILKQDYYDPQFSFYYFSKPGQPDSPLKSELSAPSLTFSTRWARDEMFIQNGNERVSMGPKRAPSIQLDYTYGFKDILESDFDYHKLQLTFVQKMRLGGFGESRLQLKGGYIFGQVPYLLLENHIGNESMFYTSGAFNTMNYFEFVSDHYASLRYDHYFQGLLMNKLPLIRKLKWRLLATANVLMGGLRQENIDVISPLDPEGNPTAPFSALDPELPYVELGYGIENILKVGRVDFVHRITYRDRPDAQKFAVKLSFQFKL